MAQIIYSLLALLMVMVLSMNMQRGIGRDQQEQSLNEVATQLTGVGTEVLELIGTQYFDRFNLDNQNTRPYCGRVADNGEEQDLLSSPSGVNFGACTDPDACAYIEGFEGLVFTRTQGEFDYEVEILSVDYVDPQDFTRVVTSDSTSFAKRVQIEVTNPYLYIGDDPNDTDRQFSLTLERVFTYGCTTDYETIPFVRDTETCPAPTPCSRWSW